MVKKKEETTTAPATELAPQQVPEVPAEQPPAVTETAPVATETAPVLGDSEGGASTGPASEPPPAEKPAQPEASATPAKPAKASKAKAAATAEAEKAPEVVSKVKRYRVLETKRISMFGQITVVHAGDVVSALEYGLDGMARLQQELKLVEVA